MMLQHKLNIKQNYSPNAAEWAETYS